MRDMYMKNGDGFLFCYSITSLSSFNDLPDLIERNLRVKDVEDPREIPMVIVGTKVDLADQRTVTTDQGQALASKLGAQFIEVSAKACFNVDAAFVKLCKLVIEKKGIEVNNGKRGKTDAKKSKNSKCNLL